MMGTTNKSVSKKVAHYLNHIKNLNDYTIHTSRTFTTNQSSDDEVTATVVFIRK